MWAVTLLLDFYNSVCNPQFRFSRQAHPAWFHMLTRIDLLNSLIKSANVYRYVENIGHINQSRVSASVN